MPRAKKTAIAAFYCAGAAVVLVLLVLTAFGPHFVPFPNAMLPMEMRELALAWLAIGFLPILLACVQFRRLVETSKSWERLLMFLPAAVCLAALVFWLVVWTLGTLQTLGLRG